MVVGYQPDGEDIAEDDAPQQVAMFPPHTAEKPQQRKTTTPAMQQLTVNGCQHGKLIPANYLVVVNDCQI